MGIDLTPWTAPAFLFTNIVCLARFDFKAIKIILIPDNFIRLVRWCHDDITFVRWRHILIGKNDLRHTFWPVSPETRIFYFMKPDVRAQLLGVVAHLQREVFSPKSQDPRLFFFDFAVSHKMQGCRLSFDFIHRKPIPDPKLFSALQFIGTDPLADLCITLISTCDIDRKKDLVFLRLKLWIPCMVFFSFFLVDAVYFRYIMKL